MAKKLNTRAAAARTSWQIIDNGQSLDAALAHLFESTDYSPQDRGFIQELVYGVCRWYGELDGIASQLLRSPIRKKDRAVHFVLLVGLYQLRHIDTAEHAAVGETVSACKQLNKLWAKNLINGCLRTYLRDEKLNSENPKATQDSHPQWIKDAISKAWPEQASKLMQANNERPAMCLRVNTRQYSRDAYLEKLNAQDISAEKDPYSQDGIILTKPVSVLSLPEFEAGACSVQDTAAQLSVEFLDAKKDMNVLDACAAPGGKSAHILERADNQLSLHALDISERRCEQLHSTLSRLDLDAQIITADAIELDQWSQPDEGYDRILIDAPCSGLGVIRRHPDIKHHRRPSDIETLNKVQQQLLLNLWPTLKPNGMLLYMTCSVLPSENEAQIVRFLKSTEDASVKPINHPDALSLEHGVQTLPGVHNMDGFYYCLLQKTSD